MLERMHPVAWGTLIAQVLTALVSAWILVRIYGAAPLLACCSGPARPIRASAADPAVRGSAGQIREAMAEYRTAFERLVQGAAARGNVFRDRRGPHARGGGRNGLRRP